MYTLYGESGSGNCYKVRLLLSLLDQPFRWVEVDVLRRETRTPEFLRKNPNGRVPVLEYAPGQYLPESNAILVYLGEGTPYWPDDRLERAQVLQWMFFEQYSHEPYIAVARFIMRYLGSPPEKADTLEAKRPGGYAALDVMEGHLAREPYLVGGRYTLADIALYAYTHVAHEGGFDLAGYPAVQAWLARVAAQPGHVPMAG